MHRVFVFAASALLLSPVKLLNIGAYKSPKLEALLSSPVKLLNISVFKPPKLSLGYKSHLRLRNQYGEGDSGPD